MGKSQRFIAGFLAFVLIATLPKAAYAEETDTGDYTVVKEGEPAPFSGYLFDAQGLIKIMVNKDLEITKITIEKNAEIERIKIELDMARKQFALESQIKDTYNNNISKLKDDRIRLLEDDKKWETLKLFGAMTLGIVLSVAIFFAAVQITNTKTP